LVLAALPGPDRCLALRRSQCYDVLVERGLSAHLMIDRDGTIYQAMDLQTGMPPNPPRTVAKSPGSRTEWPGTPPNAPGSLTGPPGS
jgi:hypothetical protein